MKSEMIEVRKEDEAEAKGAMTFADNLVKQYSQGIASNQANKQAGVFLQDIRQRIKLLNDKRLSMTRPIDEAKKKIMDFFAQPIDRLKRADQAISKAMARFFDEQEAIRQKEEAEARAKAEKEAAKLEVKAEKAEAAGKEEKAEELREQAQQVAATTPVMSSRVEKVEGIAMRMYWYFEIIDVSKIPKEYLMVDEEKLQQYAHAMKETAKVEGVRFFSDCKPVMTRTANF